MNTQEPMNKSPQPAHEQSGQQVEDPIPDPEPSVPSLSEPDPGVFHHEPKPTEAHDIPA